MNIAWSLGLSFVVGGIWVATATALAERFGSRLGGYIGGLPSTLAVALLFVALTEGHTAAANAAEIVPLAFAVNALFLLVFAALGRLGFYPALGMALILWTILQSAIVYCGGASATFSLLIWLGTITFCYFCFEIILKIRSRAATGRPVGAIVLLIRALAGGLLVLSAVAAARYWGAVASGVLASLPVVFLSTLCIVNHRLGLEFALSLARALLFSAVIHCVIFAFLFRVTLVYVPSLPAFALSYLVTLVFAIPIYRLKLG